jgi:nucleotide-binding universal stress UspA family protein
LPGIVCAVRGGPDSLITIQQAVQLASETNLSLFFVYVINLDFLSHTASSRVRTISHEMHQMGDFILLIAEEKAATLGVEAQGMVRQGQVGEEIIALCHEVRADYVVLGEPKGKGEVDVFTHERMLHLKQKIETESGAKVILAKGGGDE